MTTLTNPKKANHFYYKNLLKYIIIVFSILLTGYLVIAMYAQGEILFALLTLFIMGSAIYIFNNKSTYAWRYVFPGISGIGIFIIFPLIATVILGFTNYSSKNQLTFERAQSVLLSRQSFSGEVLNFSLIKNENSLDFYFEDKLNNSIYFVENVDLSSINEPVVLNITDNIPLEGKLNFKELIAYRDSLKNFVGMLPDGREIRLKSLREFAVSKPLYVLQSDGITILNTDTGAKIRPNFDVGFFQQIDEKEQFIPGTNTDAGFTVNIGLSNFTQVFSDNNIRGPFLSIFIWTVLFSCITVFLTTALGTILASLVQWESLKGKALYRVLLILPYAVPSFISILIFRGLFNQEFGEINQLLDMVFGIRPEWFNNPLQAKIMVIIVNTWLGYPYMMILCMGLLKAIPDDLYEASALNGATPWQNFTKITLPLLIKPLTPLMIASFAFNFNNFVLIMLLTRGGPNMTNTTAPAGHTDLLVSYTYRIAFEGGGGENFGLAAAISTIIFLIVGLIAIINMKASKMDLD
ncbi:maltose ABC transporter permease MalF [Thorsellia kenyensis]|uniref:Maltose/maltodextrin transport system permease protein n=1 Tax=Thorsellia kenyensis TaxID=1549888 RepID=A0ABV6C833_9GAMM